MAKTTIPAGYIAANAITSTELAANSVTAAAIASGALVVADIADNAITGAKIAANAVGSSELASGALSGQNFTGDVTFDTDVLFVDSVNDRVGVGTTSPSSLLHLGGATNKGIQITSATSNAGYLAVYQDQAIFSINRDGADGSFADTGKAAAVIKLNSGNADSNISLQTTTSNNAEPTIRMTIDKNGNVGIGTSSALYNAILNVAGGVNTTTGIIGTLVSDSFTFNGQTNPHYGINFDSTNSRPIGISGYAGIAFATSGTERIRILQSGNVGIGREDPTQLLEVHKDVGGDQTVAKFSAHNFGDTGKTFIEIGTEYGDGSSRIGSFNDTSNSSVLVFDTHSTTSGQFTERMRIDSSGRVRIGASGGTGQRLSINGFTQSDTMSEANAWLVAEASTGDGIAIGTRLTTPYATWIQSGYLNTLGTSNHYALALNPHGGNVGIGTENPSELLHVKGTIRHQAPASAAYYANRTYLGDTFTFGTGETSDNVDFKIAGGAFTTANSGGNFRFFTQNSNATPAQRMLIASEGYLEIASFSSNSDDTDTSTHRKIEFKANGNGEQTHKRTCFVQRYVGSTQYHWYKVVLGSNVYGRGSNIKYTANWSTGHASGQGIVDGSLICRARQDNSTIDAFGHVVYNRSYIDGTYYAWSDYPDITIYLSTATGSSAGIYMRVQGSRTSGYDGNAVHAIYLDIFGSRQDTHYQGIYHVGTSTPSDVGAAVSRNILS